MKKKVIMQGVHPNDSAILADNGLLLQAVFDLAKLPPDMLTAIEAVQPTADYRQLLVFGHGGEQMWRALSESKYEVCEHPVDRFSVGATESQAWSYSDPCAA